MLQAADMRAIKVQRSRVNHDTYRAIYDMCAASVQTRAQRGDTEVYFQIPSIVPGRPAYNVSHAMRYVVNKLTRGGFTVTQAHEQVVYVSWAPEPRVHTQPESPKGPESPKKGPTVNERLTALKAKYNT